MSISLQCQRNISLQSPRNILKQQAANISQQYHSIYFNVAIFLNGIYVSYTSLQRTQYIRHSAQHTEICLHVPQIFVKENYILQLISSHTLQIQFNQCHQNCQENIVAELNLTLSHGTAAAKLASSVSSWNYLAWGAQFGFSYWQGSAYSVAFLAFFLRERCRVLPMFVKYKKV